ncbi:hypothetical protein GGR58DRAFT_505987 [Xylaria digitata]|nr:hypothetical protein GGR58DRAFT_505987 [Xylaria digitata]
MSFMPYARPGKGASNNNTENRNPRYKGKNYDPNYHEKKRNQRNQQYQQNNNQPSQNYFTQQLGANNSSEQWNHFGSTSNPHFNNHQPQKQPHMPGFNIQQQQTQQQKGHEEQERQQRLQRLQQLQQNYNQQQWQNQPLQPLQQGTTPSANLPMQFLAHFSEEVGQRLARDFEGDTRICGCNKPPECFHTIAMLYQNQLVQSGQVQHDIVSLLTHLMAKGDEVQRRILQGLAEFLQKNPQTPLRTILETMGREGLVSMGVGAPSGPGVAVVTDNSL